MKVKLFNIVTIMIFCILINTIVNAKYIIENQFEIANLNIDITNPILELVDIKDIIIEDENNKNKFHDIIIKIRINEKNIKNVILDKEHIKLKSDNNYINSETLDIVKINSDINNEFYQIKLKDIQANKKIKIEFLEGTVIDQGDLKNKLFEIDVFKD